MPLRKLLWMPCAIMLLFLVAGCGVSPTPTHAAPVKPKPGSWTGAGSSGFVKTISFVVTEQGTITDFTFEMGISSPCSVNTAIPIDAAGSFRLNLDEDTHMQATFDSETTLSGTYTPKIVCDQSNTSMVGRKEDLPWKAQWQAPLPTPTATPKPG